MKMFSVELVNSYCGPYSFCFITAGWGFILRAGSCSSSPAATLNVNCVHHDGSQHVVSELVKPLVYQSVPLCHSVFVSLCCPHVTPNCCPGGKWLSRIKWELDKWNDNIQSRMRPCLPVTALGLTLCWSFYSLSFSRSKSVILKNHKNWNSTLISIFMSFRIWQQRNTTQQSGEAMRPHWDRKASREQWRREKGCFSCKFGASHLGCNLSAFSKMELGEKKEKQTFRRRRAGCSVVAGHFQSAADAYASVCVQCHSAPCCLFLELHQKKRTQNGARKQLLLVFHGSDRVLQSIIGSPFPFQMLNLLQRDSLQPVEKARLVSKCKRSLSVLIHCFLELILSLTFPSFYESQTDNSEDVHPAWTFPDSKSL